jgi:aspartate aminotransferase
MTAGDGSAGDLSHRASQIEVSPTVAMAQRAAALRGMGRALIDLTVGEPDQDTPRHIVDAAVEALNSGRTRYTASAGLRELRAAVALRYRKDSKVTFSEDEVAVTNGGKHALYLACQALLDRGDEVVIPSPHWPTFSEAVRLAGARPILVQAREQDGFQVTARMISKVTSPRTRAVILNSPANPTGAVIESEDLLVIGDMAQRRRFTLLYDDAYARLMYRRVDAGVLQALRDAVGDRFVVLGTASKTYCMTGWRLGWVLGTKALVDACAALASHSTQCPTSFVQVAAVQALTGPQQVVQEMAAEYRQRRDVVLSDLRAIPRVTCVEPGGGFYAFPNVGRHLTPAMPSTSAMAMRLLDEVGLGVVPGEAFAAPGYIRISFARPVEELREGLRCLAAFLDRQARA